MWLPIFAIGPSAPVLVTWARFWPPQVPPVGFPKLTPQFESENRTGIRAAALSATPDDSAFKNPDWQAIGRKRLSAGKRPAPAAAEIEHSGGGAANATL